MKILMEEEVSLANPERSCDHTQLTGADWEVAFGSGLRKRTIRNGLCTL